MTNTQQPSRPSPPKKNKSTIWVLIIPLISCMCSSVVGIVIGQIGNLFYKVIGQAAGCLAIPGFAGLFLVTFGLSFLSNKLLRKWLK
ncbi:MAG: hypothetical protein Kow002_02150 [Anaerolineales bacterium]